MKVKAVFHVDWEKEENLIMGLNNMENLLKVVPAEQASVFLLANGPSVKLFLRNRSLSYGSIISGLSKNGVRFLLCNNSIEKFGISRSDLLEDCEIIPAGVVKLIRLQAEGYAYIKP